MLRQSHIHTISARQARVVGPFLWFWALALCMPQQKALTAFGFLTKTGDKSVSDCVSHRKTRNNWRRLFRRLIQNNTRRWRSPWPSYASAIHEKPNENNTSQNARPNA